MQKGGGPVSPEAAFGVTRAREFGVDDVVKVVPGPPDFWVPDNLSTKFSVIEHRLGCYMEVGFAVHFAKTFLAVKLFFGVKNGLFIFERDLQ